MASRARTEAACLSAAVADLRPANPLLDAIVRAVGTADHAGMAHANAATEREIDEAENAAWNARADMLAEFRKLGIGENWVRKIGGVL